MLDNIEHLGDLMRRVRDTRDLKQEDISEKGNINTSTISGIESGRQIATVRDTTFMSYLDGIGLSSSERDLLLYRFFHPSRHINYHERNLHSFNFATLKDETNNDCNEIITSLETAEYPAYVRDDLWFVHCYNQAILDLFDLQPDDLKDSWAAWHVIGTKYYPGSKLARAHGENASIYFPQAVKQFFEETGPFFFTAQMKALRNRLWGLSKDYQKAWLSTTALATPFKQRKHLKREILYRGVEISMGLSEGEIFYVDIGEEQDVRYELVKWWPYGAASSITEQAFDQIAKAAESPQKIHYAADYIQDYNEWPEIKRSLHELSR